MRTFMFIKKDNGEIKEIAGPYIEEDQQFEDGVEIIDECIFKSLHPEEYKRTVMENLASAIMTWLERFYDNKKEIYEEGNCIISNQFIIQVTLIEIHLMFYHNCSPTEAASLSLYLKSCVFEEVSITCSAIPLIDDVFCDN